MNLSAAEDTSPQSTHRLHSLIAPMQEHRQKGGGGATPFCRESFMGWVRVNLASNIINLTNSLLESKPYEELL